jgi:hypothetical protein
MDYNLLFDRRRRNLVQEQDLPMPSQRLVVEVNGLRDMENDERGLHSKVGEAIFALVASDDCLTPAFARPHPLYSLRYPLNVDPADRFSALSFVAGAGQQRVGVRLYGSANDSPSTSSVIHLNIVLASLNVSPGNTMIVPGSSFRCGFTIESIAKLLMIE